jgi:hypothetical protein
MAKPFAGQSGDAPLQRSSTSQLSVAARHTRAAPSSEQVPLTPAPFATEHASHAPAHAESQHTPSAQLAETHSLAAAHAAPSGFFAAQYWPLQYAFPGHPAEQRMGQSLSVPLQVTRPPQAGLPGSFAGAGRQLPSWPGRLQRSQLPVQAWPQHTPSAQKPDAHSGLA